MKFAEKTVEEFLFTPGKSFIIPDFQRPYSWQVSNVREFLDDLEEAVAKDKSHYFGTVVFVLDDIDSNSIIDGQQRITTALLMITAIYHILKTDPARSSKLSALDIKEKYLVNRNETNRIKLRTVTTDDLILQKIYDVDGDSTKLTQQEKQSNLYTTYAEFKKYFKDKQDLEKYIQGLGNLEIITIALDARDDNPQRVFESINSTGRPLTDGDKIRNFALMLNTESLRKHVYSRYWQTIEHALTDVNKDYITDFFRSYIITKRRTLIRLDAVYPEFKKLFDKHIGSEHTVEKIDAFYGEIIEYLGYYLLCKFESDPHGNYDSIKDVVFKMRYIQTEIYIPFAMAVLAHYHAGEIDETELSQVFDLIETYFSRRIVCNINTTSVDKFFASLHKEVLDYQGTTPESGYVDILRYIMLRRTGPTRLPSDAEVEAAIRHNHIYNQRTAHVNYILTAIDDQSKESETLRHIASKQLKLSIEHVMPQKLANGWDDELGVQAKGLEYVHEVHGKYLHTLANLTLTGYNPEYQNYSFEKKKTMTNGFNESKLGINKWIAAQDVWDETVMQRRQEWWVHELQKVWPMPTTSFQPVDVETHVHLLDQTDLKGSIIRSLTLFGDTHAVSSWAETLDLIVEKLYDRNHDFKDVVMGDERTARYFSSDNSTFYASAEIFETGYFVDTGTETNTKLRLIKALAELFEIDHNDLLAELSMPSED